MRWKPSGSTWPTPSWPRNWLRSKSSCSCSESACTVSPTSFYLPHHFCQDGRFEHQYSGFGTRWVALPWGGAELSHKRAYRSLGVAAIKTWCPALRKTCRFHDSIWERLCSAGELLILRGTSQTSEDHSVTSDGWRHVPVLDLPQRRLPVNFWQRPSQT